MSYSDPWTQAQLLAQAQRELLDPSAKFWPVSELNGYIELWQRTLQSDFEFVWTTAAVLLNTSTLLGTTVSTATVALTSIATDMMRLDALYWQDGTNAGPVRLSMRTKEELDILDRNWRNAVPSEPSAVYQDDVDTVSLWPPPAVQGTLTAEYPQAVMFTTSTTPMSIPAWTKYSCKNFVCYHALLRTGPNQDLARAQRRKKKYTAQLLKFRTIMGNHFPDRSTSLSPAGRYEMRILEPQRRILSDLGQSN